MWAFFKEFFFPLVTHFLDSNFRLVLALYVDKTAKYFSAYSDASSETNNRFAIAVSE